MQSIKLNDIFNKIVNTFRNIYKVFDNIIISRKDWFKKNDIDLSENEPLYMYDADPYNSYNM